MQTEDVLRRREPQASVELSRDHFRGRVRGYGRGTSRVYSICCTLR